MSESIRLEIRPGTDPEVGALEYEIYLNAGYIPPNPRRRVLENDAYPDHDIVVASVGDMPVGSVRLVVDPDRSRGLFSLHCFAPFDIWSWADRFLHDVPANGVLQVGTMVIREGFRGGPVFQQMFQKILEMSVQERIRVAVATIDEAFFDRLSRRKVPFVAMGDARHYMGSRTVPALIARDWVTRGAVPSSILALEQRCAGADRIGDAAAMHSA